MANLAHTHGPENRLDFNEIKARFLAINTARLERAMADLHPRQRDCIALLPLLFHVNHPALPGYINRTTPAGIPDYSPPNPTIALAKKIAKRFSYEHRTNRRCVVDAIYMQVGTGMIAPTNRQDVDIWVCYRDGLKPHQVNALQKKARALEQWSQSLGVKTHLRLVNPTDLREGKREAMTGGRHGIAPQTQLLEEFYANGLLLAGRYPIWWCVPPEQEMNYSAIVSEINASHSIQEHEYLDFGGLNQPLASEFYCTTLLTLCKGIHSPYESILHTLQMKACADEFPHVDVPAVRFKQAIYAGENDINELDPCLTMLRKVEDYLNRRNEPQRVDLARRSFYFQVNEKLSEEAGAGSGWRRDLMTRLTQAWGWTSSQIYLLDSRDNWKIRRVIREYNELSHEFSNSYRFLSEFARKQPVPNRINALDLKLHRRKLYTTFEHKAGKIDIIYRGITSSLHETHMSIHRIRNSENSNVWVIFNGIVTEEDLGQFIPLWRAYSIVELLAWCYFNRVIASDTMVSIHAYNSDLSEKEVHSIVSSMEETFAHALLEDDSLAAYRTPATVKKIITLINAGSNPESRQTHYRKYPVCQLENLFYIDQVVVTSWHEVLTLRYSGIDGLFRCLQEYLQRQPPSLKHRPPSINAISHSGVHSDAIANRVETLFQNVMDCFYSDSNPPGTHFILGIEQDYYLLHMERDTLQYRNVGDLDDLRNLLATPSFEFRHVVFDPLTLRDDVLPLLYAHNQPGMIQAFFHIDGGRVTSYILDEQGSLHIDENDFHDAISLVNRYETFFHSVVQRLQFQREERTGATRNLHFTFHYLKKCRNGKWAVIWHRNNHLFKPEDTITIQLIVEKFGDDTHYRAYCDNLEFTSVEHGEKLFNHLADHIMKQRTGHGKYPVFITDIDLSTSLLESNSVRVQTVHYLQYKAQIENILLDILHNHH